MYPLATSVYNSLIPGMIGTLGSNIDIRVGEINVSHFACLLTPLLRCINDYID